MGTSPRLPQLHEVYLQLSTPENHGFAGMIWKNTGESGFVWINWAIAIVITLIASWAGLVVFDALISRWSRARWMGLAAAGALVVAGILTAFHSLTGAATAGVSAALPFQLVKDADPEATYFSPRAAMAFQLSHPDQALPQQDYDPNLSPSEWRDLMRQNGWKHAMIAGPETSNPQILLHLVSSPDWQMTKITPEGFALSRGWDNSPKKAAVQHSIDQLSPEEAAALSSNLHQIGAKREASSILSDALEAFPDSTAVHAAAATQAAHSGRWNDAWQSALSLEALNPKDPRAPFIKAKVAQLRGDSAGMVMFAREAVKMSNGSTASLMQLAEAYRADRNFYEEYQTLKRLLTQESQKGIPTAGVAVYMGQAAMQMGDAIRAREAFTAAIESGALEASQQQEVEELLEELAVTRRTDGE